MKASEVDNKSVRIPPNTTSNSIEVVLETPNPLRVHIEDLQGLARRIKAASPMATVRFAYHEPDQIGLGVTWAEVINIWLPRMTDAFAAALAIDIGKVAIKWARKRFSRGRRRTPKIIYIYNENGKVLREIHLKDKRTDPEIIIPSTDIRTGRKMAPLREEACGNFQYALMLVKRFLRGMRVTIVGSPQLMSRFVQGRIKAKAERRLLHLYEQAFVMAADYKGVRRLVIDKIRPSLEFMGGKVREHVTYGSDIDAVQFETVCEDAKGDISHLVHIHCVAKGSKSQEIRRYLESLAEFQEKCKNGILKAAAECLMSSLLSHRKNPKDGC